MQSYFGSLEVLNSPRLNVEALRKQRDSPCNSPAHFLNRKRKKNIEIQKSQDSRQEMIDASIKVNVSGKCFRISPDHLAKYPESLLSNNSKRKRYFDPNRNEYFFDHNRTIAESVYNFYQYGILERPENIPEFFFVEEIRFYGLQEYLHQETKETVDEIQEKYRYQSSPQDWRDKLSSILESPTAKGGDWCARGYNIFSLSLILFSIFLLCYDTHVGQPIQTKSTDFFHSINEKWVFLSETICICYFTVELFLRFIVTHQKRRFLCSFLNLIDFVAILPFYINLFFDIHRITAPLSVLRVLRIGKTFRVLKISRYNTSLLIIGKTLQSGRWDLWMLCFLLLIACVLFGSITYYVEEFFLVDSQFQSIPAAIWWALITTLTIGYGNITPQSSAGRLAGALCAVSGVIILAPILPIIFGRWTRFNQLHNEAKIHNKCKRLNTNIHEEIEHLNVIRVKGNKQKEHFFF